MAEEGYLWTKIKSWHLTETVLPPDGMPSRTLCGRAWDESRARDPEPPSGEATCESCFRVRESRA